MQGFAALFEDPIVLLIVLIVGVIAWSAETGYYHSAEHLLRAMDKHKLSALAARLKWLYRMVLFLLTSVYLGSVILPLYGTGLANSIAYQLQQEVYFLSWFSLLAFSIFHLVFRKGIFSTQAVPVRNHHLLSILRLSLFYDGFPRFMGSYHILIKLAVLIIYAVLVLPLAAYLSYTLAMTFARWNGFINHRRTSM
jgi:hypothetical protein